MGFGYELGVSGLIAEIVDQLNLVEDVQSGLLAAYMDDFYWATTYEKMVKVIERVQTVGPNYGYRLNMDKSIYLMAPALEYLSDQQLENRIKTLESLGIPRENIKIHPNCQNTCSSSIILQREEQWGIKVLGAYVGHHKYVAKHLENILRNLQEKVEILLKYPNVQARYFLHHSISKLITVCGLIFPNIRNL